MLVEHRQKRAFEAVMNRQLTSDYLEKMDADSNGQVSRAEYVEFMLVELGIVDKEQLQILNSQFDRLDVTRTGYLDGEDLRLMAELNKEQLERELA